MRKVKRMTNRQFTGIIKMIIELIKSNIPQKDLIIYLEKLIE